MVLICHRENGGALGMVPLIVNPIYTLYSGYLLDPNPLLKGSNRGVKQRAEALHPKSVPSIFPMNLSRYWSVEGEFSKPAFFHNE